MNRTLLLAPTGRGVGLTASCLGLVHALQQRGVDVGFLKPLAQPAEAVGRADTTSALARLACGLDSPDPIAADRVEQLLSRDALDALLELVVAAAQPLIERHDVLVVEGLKPAPGLVYASRVNAAVAKALDADVVLVGAAAGHDFERLAENVAIAAQAYASAGRARVIGAVANRLPEDAAGEVGAALARHRIALAAAVPFQAELTWPRVRDIIAGLDTTEVNAGDPDRRVKEVLVAAQAVPGLLPLLREGRLLIVPGDRHEVILSACLAAMNGIQLAGLVLTLDVQPDPRVWELCRPAAATGLPVLLTASSTYEAATIVHDVDPSVPPEDAERAQRLMTSVAGRFDPEWLTAVAVPAHASRLSPPAFRRLLTQRAALADRRIVLPEGLEPRTIRAAVSCHELGLARCVLLADPVQLAARAEGLGITLPDGLEALDPAVIAEDYVDELVAARRHKGMTPDRARDELADAITLGAMMLRLGRVDGMVAGAVHTTAATLRPALQLIGPAPGAQLVSSIFFMCLPDEVVVYGDCAVNPDPDAQQLADIAVQSAASARRFGIEPRVAMISFSTGSSGAGADVDKVREATRLVREREPGLLVDGPLQYDAAAIASVARDKAPGSAVAGRATVFVFPDLNTGNTTYKAVQRSANIVSIGPMLQGLAKPVNDLSRGALVDDIVYTIAITAIQAAGVGAAV
ncbi:MAG TPA: phosphate acetyltransferase [Jatrophihabitans sp.]|jgi:phosphate acetyltransferase|uniref:phosphate acetyltransferase n=1 Tax=Jatrophihabitans sp. TaxID=1932789 RepID=UPI002E056EA9|nr:phosphate acetyltransferase [Jatrophihabitans sp.]